MSNWETFEREFQAASERERVARERRDRLLAEHAQEIAELKARIERIERRLEMADE